MPYHHPPMRHAMKRKSTTKKVVKKDLINLKNIFAHGDGVVVRFQGTEYGALKLVGTTLKTYEGVALDARSCTIRKGLPTVEQPV